MSGPSTGHGKTGTSSYLDYLPPVLWDLPRDAGTVPLGDLLLVFEKVLTGVADSTSLVHGDHVHPAITTEIDLVYRVFDPWVAPESALDWLAAGLALEAPTLRGRPSWNEYQRRAMIAAISRIYALRGTKAGLSRFLETFSARRARIAIDDGARLLALTPGAAAVARVVPLVTQGPVLSGERIVTQGLLRPWSVAATSDGGLVVGDIAMPDALGLPFKSRVWLLDTAGGLRMTGTPPSPQPLAADTLPLNRVVAVAVRPAQAATAGKPATPETVYALDRDGRLYSIPRPFERATQLTLASGGITDAPAAMAFDPRSGQLIVLGRGTGPGTANPHKVIAVGLDPFTVNTAIPLKVVREPLSLAVDRDGALLVGDGREQAPTAPDQRAGNVVRVDRTTTPWTETVLLPADNPLVAPTGIARTRDGELYVLDAGLKPFAPPTTFPFISAVAQAAGVFRVALGAAPAAVRVTEPGQLVYPTGMVATGGRLVVADPGQPLNGWSLGSVELKRSRALPFQFDVVVHFAGDRLPTDEAGRQATVRRVVSIVRAIAERQRPAHARCNVISG